MARQGLSALAVACSIALAFGTLRASAHDLGTQGATFDIIEVDILKLISRRLHEAQADGSLDQMNQQFSQRAQKRIMNPPPVFGVSDTVKPKTWLYDPTIVSPQDYSDQKGVVFAHKGERINPLERMPSYNKVLIFINGKDPAQVRYALGLQKTYGQVRTRLILTNGSPIDLNRKHVSMFYFDQDGILTRKFGITQVPATVVRENDLLRVSEVRP
jgi:conjugal transfer pilus assembly protein TraW